MSDSERNVPNGEIAYDSTISPQTGDDSENANQDNPERPPSRFLYLDHYKGLLMVLQSIDHCAVALQAYAHGVAYESEANATPVHRFQELIPFVARGITHLCAPGFTFSLGLGIVLFAQSRQVRSNWGAKHLVGHFTLRGFAIFVVNQIFFTGMANLSGELRGVWLVNTILVSLALNYTLLGSIWTVLHFTEPWLAIRTNNSRRSRRTTERRRLLESGARSKTLRSQAISWYLHNILLLLLIFVTMGWNSWLSLAPHGCDPHSDSEASPTFRRSHRGHIFDFLFYPMSNSRVVSLFPPLAWASFAISGLFYGRLLVVTERDSALHKIGLICAGSILLALFGLSRLLHVGNLSEGCLHIDEHLFHHGRNQYFSDLRSFLYVVKYPPSPAFFCLTMGLNLYIIALFLILNTSTVGSFEPLRTFGRSALFFYIAHIQLFRWVGKPIKQVWGHPMDFKDMVTGETAWGVGTGYVFWFTWIGVLAILYVFCGMWDKFKSRQGPGSLWRLF